MLQVSVHEVQLVGGVTRGQQCRTDREDLIERFDDFALGSRESAPVDVGAVREDRDPLGGDSGIARGDPRILHRIGEVGRAVGQHAGGAVDMARLETVRLAAADAGCREAPTATLRPITFAASPTRPATTVMIRCGR